MRTVSNLLSDVIPGQPRHRRRLRCLVKINSLLFWIGLALSTPVRAAPIAIDSVQRAEPVSFEKEILPILQRNCLACHSSSESQGELVLESPQGILKGGDNGPAAIPGRGAESLILKAAAHQIETVMPPEKNDVAAKNLSSQELGLLKLWIDQGAQGTSGIDALSPKGWQAIPKGIQAVHAVALTEDGQYVAFSRANRIFLSHVPTGQFVTMLSDPALHTPNVTPGLEHSIAHRDLVQSLTFNVDGDMLASGAFREAKLWRRPRDVQQFQLTAGGPVTALAISPDRLWIATTGAAHTVRLWKAVDGQPGPTLTGHTNIVTSLRFTLDSTQLVSGSLDQTIRFWNVVDGTPITQFETPAPVNAVEIVMREAPTAQVPIPPQLLVSGGSDNLLRVWSLANAMPEKLATSLPNLVRSVASRDGKLLAMVDAAGTVRVVSLAPPQGQPFGAEVATWPIEHGVTQLAFHRPTDLPDATQEAPANGTSLFTTAANGSIRQWSLPEHQLLAEWKGGQISVKSLAVSADGAQAATGCEDGMISLWNLKSELPARTPFSESIGVSDAPFNGQILSPTRQELALAGVKDGQPAVFIANLENGTITHTFAGHTATIRSVAFSSDGNRVVSGGNDQAVRVWDLRNPQKPDLAKIAGLSATVLSVGANADASLILVGTADNSLKLFNPVDGMVVKEFAGHGGAILACGYWNGQPYSVCADRAVRFWNAADGVQTRVFSLPAGITGFGISTDGQRMGFGGDDLQTRVVQTDNGSVRQSLKGTLPTTALSFTSDLQQLTTITATGEVAVWNLMNSHLHESFTVPGLSAATFVTDTNSLVTSHADGTIGRRTLRFLRHLEGNTQPVTSLLFQSNGQLLFSAASDGSLRSYNTQNGQSQFTTSHGAAVHDLAISTNEQVLASAGENGQVRLWQTNGGGAYGPQLLQGFAGPVTRVVFTADGTQVIAGGSGDKPAVLAFDLATGAVLQRFTEQASSTFGLACLLPLPLPANTPSLAPSPVTTMLTSSSTGVWTWSLAAIRQIPGHQREVTSLASIPGSPRQVFSGSLEGTIRRWNLETGQEMQQFNHGGSVTAIAVSPDGQRLASATDNTHTAKLWNINGQQLAEMRGDLRKRTAQTRAQQQLTAANARLNVAKQLLEVADKDVPFKTTAEKTLSDMLTAANADVLAKKAALDVAFVTKTATEKAAIDASTAAKLALAAKAKAEQAAKDATTLVTTVQAKLSRLQQSANADQTSEKLKQLVIDAQKLLESSQLELQQMTAAIATPTQVSTEMANLANTAAQNVNEVQKPYSDALTALKTAEANQNLLSQQQVIAARELIAAQELLPARKEVSVLAETAAAEAQKRLDTSNMEAQAADQPIRSIAFSPEGTLLATAGDLPNVHTWDAQTGAAMGTFAGHTGPLKGVAFLSQSQLVSVSDDQSARVWEVNPSWALERTIGSIDDPTVISHRVTSVDFSRDSTLLLLAGGVPSRSGELQVVRVADGGRVLYLPQAHEDVVYSAQFSPDAKRIASGGADKYLRTFEIATSQQLRRFEGHTNYVLGVAWQANGQIISTASADNTVKVWESETGDQQRTIEGFPRHITAIRYIGETENIVTSCGDKLVRMHTASNGGLFRNFGEIEAWPHCVAITPDSNILAAGDAAGTVSLWNGNTGQFLKALKVDVPTIPVPMK